MGWSLGELLGYIGLVGFWLVVFFGILWFYEMKRHLKTP